eukprot:TRINITY_DN2170_c0_g5_i9.p1 TRINITY_DN2170_c0_g5~~TRINITY_DN2170_c0_g5_i9.p1  ORF type:complete len:275 (+),score=70.24 TRINITY_DN2170_c0_g5_i9:458-1282(+)
MEEISINLQAVMMFFIDGLSFIDHDPYWHYYLLYRVCKKKDFTLIGYATTYESHQSAIKYRTRISQMLILPLFQRKGFGAQILASIYRDLRNDPSCFEITVEDPSDEFLAMRDFNSIKILLGEGKFSCFKELGVGKKITAENLAKFKLSKEELKSIQKEFKLTKVEVEQCFEMVKFALLDQSDEEAVRLFRIVVKKRLFLMHKESLIPDERLIKMKKGIINKPIIVFEGIYEEDVEPDKIQGISLSDRKKLLDCYYSECIGSYKTLAPKLLTLL